MQPNMENMIVAPITKGIEIITSIKSLPHFMNQPWLQGKQWKEKLFLQIQSFNIMYPNIKNKIVVPTTKGMKIITSIEDCLIHGWTLVTRKMVERKAFLANPKHQYRVSQYGEHDFSAHSKKNDDYYAYQSFTHFLDEH